MKDANRENVASLLPVITEFEKPFWDALQNEKLLVQKCSDCGNIQFPPSPVCTNCMSSNVNWAECSGKAKLWSKVTFHKSYLKPYSDVPYTVGLAKLEEGHIVTGRLADEYKDTIKIDDDVKIDFCKTADGTVLIEIVPAEL